MARSGLGEIDLAALAQGLKPYVLPWISSPATGTGGAAGGLSAHELDGAYHSGTLANAQGPQFLLVDGSRSLTGNLSVSAGKTIDGVDISAHAANVNAHHAKVHSITGADHSITASQYQVVGATGTNTLGLLTPSADVSGGGSAILRSASGALTLNVLTAGGATPKVRTPTIDTASGNMTLDPAGGTVVIDNTAQVSFINTASGDLALAPASTVTTAESLHASTRLRTPLLENAAGDLKVDSSTDLFRIQPSVRMQSENYASQVTGWAIDYAGGGDFRYIFVDEMHAKSFIADLEQALAGGQIISKSVAVLYADFTLPAAGASATFIVRDLPSATGMAVFVNSDYVRFRKFTRSGGGLTIADAWGTVTLDTTYGVSGFDSATKTQRYTFNRTASTRGGTATGTVNADAIILDYGTDGNGLYEVNAIDGTYALNSPYLQFIKWATHPQDGQAVRLRLGNLKGITGQTDEYGLWAGAGTADADQYIRLSSYTNRLNNLPMEWWTGGAKFIGIDTTYGIAVEVSTAQSGQRAYTFNGSVDPLGGMYGWEGASTVNIGVRSATLTKNITVSLDGLTDSSHWAVSQLSAGGAGGNSFLYLVSGTVPGLTSSDITKLHVDASWAYFNGTLEVDGLASLDGKLSLPAGSAAAPSVYFGYADTGIYGPADGQVALVSNGTARVTATTAGATITGILTATTSLRTQNGVVETDDDTTPLLLYNGTNAVARFAESGGAWIQLGNGITADQSTYIDLVGDTTYTDWGCRIVRNSGANSATTIAHRGTGALEIRANESNGTISFQVSTTTERLGISSSNVDASVPFARNGTAGYIFVPITPVDLHDGTAAWAGAKSATAGTYSFDMSTANNLNITTSTIKAYAVMLSGQWAAANQNSWASVRPKAGLGATECFRIRGAVAAINMENAGIVYPDANGDIDVVVNNATCSSAQFRCVGYFI